jgi:hypothetical protein
MLVSGICQCDTSAMAQGTATENESYQIVMPMKAGVSV